MISSYARFQGYKQNFVHVPTSVSGLFPIPQEPGNEAKLLSRVTAVRFLSDAFLGYSECYLSASINFTQYEYECN